MKPRIISLIPVNGEWINQDDLPADVVGDIVEKTIKRAAANIGFEAVKSLSTVQVCKKEKTA